MGAGEDSGAFPIIAPDAPAPDDDGSLAALVRRLEALAAAVPDAMAEAAGPGDVTRIDLAHQVRDAVVALSEASAFYRAGLADGRAECPVPLPPRERQPPSHRRERPDWIRRVKGIVPLPAASAALRNVLHHGPVAKALAIPGVKVAAIATASTAAVAAVGTAAVVTFSPAHAGTPAFGTAGVPAPAASIEGAVPFPSGSPALIARITRPERKAKDPVLSGTGLLWPPASSPATSPAPPSASVSWSPSWSPAPAGTLNAGQDITVPDPTQGTQITVTVTGADVQWQAWVSGPGKSDVTLTPASGILTNGNAATIGVTFDAAAQAAGGSVVVHISSDDGGYARVRVTWPPVVPPAPSLAPPDTSTPTDAATLPPTPNPSGT